MNENGYKIMHVSDGTDSRYGNIFIIKANNIKSVILLLQVHSLRNRNTKPTEIGIVVPTL